MQEFTLGPLDESRSAPGGRQLGQAAQAANLGPLYIHPLRWVTNIVNVITNIVRNQSQTSLSART